MTDNSKTWKLTMGILGSLAALAVTLAMAGYNNIISELHHTRVDIKLLADKLTIVCTELAVVKYRQEERIQREAKEREKISEQKRY